MGMGKKTRTLLVSLVMAAASAHAQAPPAPGAAQRAAPTAEELKRFKALLTKGRALEAKGEHASAAATFEEALRVLEDASALSELAWSAFAMKDLPRAEAAARKAIARGTTPSVRASAYYNLGRICEAKSDRACAISSYSDSLGQRHNEAVRKHLASLDPQLAAARGPLAPVAMLGPFTTLSVACEDLKKRCLAQETPDYPGFPSQSKCTGSLRNPLSSPVGFLSAGILVASCGGINPNDQNSPDFTETLHLALQTPGGFYLADTGGLVRNGRIMEGQWKTLSLTQIKLASGQSVLEYRWHTDRDWRDISWQAEGVVLAGIGPSGVPSVVSLQLLDHEDNERTEPPFHGDRVRLKLKVLPSGELDVSTAAKLAPELKPLLLGRHALRFL